jgi:hypothetical protein
MMATRKKNNFIRKIILHMWELLDFLSEIISNMIINSEYTVKNCNVIEENANQCGHSQMKNQAKQDIRYFLSKYIAHSVQQLLYGSA